MKKGNKIHVDTYSAITQRVQRVKGLLGKYKKELEERQKCVDVEMIAEAEGKVEATEACLALLLDT